MANKARILRKKIGKLKKELYRIRAAKHKRKLREEEKHKRKLLIQERKRKHKERVYGRLRKQEGFLYKQLHIVFIAQRDDIIDELPVWTVLMDIRHVVTWEDIDKAFLKAQYEEGQTGWAYIDHKVDKIHYKRILGITLEQWL